MPRGQVNGILKCDGLTDLLDQGTLIWGLSKEQQQIRVP